VLLLGTVCLKPLAAFLLGTAVICAAQTKSGKTPTAKDGSTKRLEGYVLPGSIFIKDLGCAKDYAKALFAEGIERRKMLADLFTYGCIEELQVVVSVYSLDLPDVKQTISRLKDGRPVPAFVAWKVVCTKDSYMTEALMASQTTIWADGVAAADRLLEKVELFQVGWIGEESVVPLNEEQMHAVIMKAKASR
jgi:hypothetical protein